jgi:hypothetical protein
MAGTSSKNNPEARARALEGGWRCPAGHTSPATATRCTHTTPVLQLTPKTDGRGFVRHMVANRCEHTRPVVTV